LAKKKPRVSPSLEACQRRQKESERGETHGVHARSPRGGTQRVRGGAAKNQVRNWGAEEASSAFGVLLFTPEDLAERALGDSQASRSQGGVGVLTDDEFALLIGHVHEDELRFASARNAIELGVVVHQLAIQNVVPGDGCRMNLPADQQAARKYSRTRNPRSAGRCSGHRRDPGTHSHATRGRIIDISSPSRSKKV
jgi:hypothetical protein